MSLSFAPSTLSRNWIDFRLPHLPAARVLHQIRTVPNITRSMLHDHLGYSQPSVTRYVRVLLDAGLVEELDGAADGERTGRPYSTLSIDGRHLITWGMHIGLRSTTLVVADGGGRVIREKTIGLPLSALRPEEALEHAAEALTNLGRGLPTPTGVGAVLSAHTGRDGRVTSPIYGWEDVDVPAVLDVRLPRPVFFGTGVAAMAGLELFAAPLRLPGDRPGFGSTLYFYAREMINHAWIFNGAVHHPHSGSPPAVFRGLAAEGPLTGGRPEQGIHPLGDTAVIRAASAAGIKARDLRHLVQLSETDPRGRAILDERAMLLGRAIGLAVDVVDPESLVLAGEAFTSDRRGLQLIADHLRAHGGGPGQLRIQRASGTILGDAARLSGMYQLWQDPLGALSE